MSDSFARKSMSILILYHQIVIIAIIIASKAIVRLNVPAIHPASLRFYEQVSMATQTVTYTAIASAVAYRLCQLVTV